jgi:hypothetical protein
LAVLMVVQKDEKWVVCLAVHWAAEMAAHSERHLVVRKVETTVDS